MHCKFCQSLRVMRYGFKTGTQYYKCVDCGHKSTGRASPEGMRFLSATIGASLGLFYDGLPLARIRKRLVATDGTHVTRTSIWRWIIKYSEKAEQILNKIEVKTSRRWVLNEMVVKIGSGNYWVWDVINVEDGFILASHFTEMRTASSASAVLYKAKGRIIGTPIEIVSNGMTVYPSAIEEVFGANTTHIRAKRFTAELDANIMEIFQVMAKERTKVMRRLKTFKSAKVISQGFIMHYYFLHHQANLNDKEPARTLGLQLPFKTWTELVDYHWRNSEHT